MATDPQPPHYTTAFCITCNARERIIDARGKCVVCRCDPKLKTRDDATDPPELCPTVACTASVGYNRPPCVVCPHYEPTTTDPPTILQRAHESISDWSRLDFYILVLCIITTWYLIWQVVRWVV